MNTSYAFILTYSPLEDGRFHINEYEKEVIETYVSTCDLHRQSNKFK